ncbi:MAG TPA: hypothetical protein VL490_11830 [Mucilaginibacter sp.]|jgi:hypothetical protein|nr:hypothetical protein [Mucilaginibacter sp.]
MIKYTKFFITFLLAVIVLQARSQSTANTSSPYSQYGIGDLAPAWLPQNTAMGGIATGINTINGFNTINPLNPASYGAIGLTTIDVGLYASSTSLSQSGQPTQQNGNFRLSHIAFAIPLGNRSAFSFGLLPYSQVGYNYKQTLKNYGSGSSVDTNAVNYVYNGEGGLSKAYIGYGVTIARHLLLGFNASYIFGNIKHFQSTEIPSLVGTLNSRIENDNAVSGFTYDYGAQYIIDLSLTKHIVIGYSATAKSMINSQNTYIVSQYSTDANGNPNVATDSLVNQPSNKVKIQLPQINHFGISYQKDLKYLIGADYTMGHWSDLSIGGVNQGTVNSSTFNIGGQYTPNMNSLNSYLATVDYRLGFMLDNTYYNIANPTGGGYTNIKSKAVTFGLGLPLRPGAGGTFYKVNFSAELGQRGTLNNGLVDEKYINLRIGFTLNDKWFQRYKFE